jgi:hypothetical protein
MEMPPKSESATLCQPEYHVPAELYRG